MNTQADLTKVTDDYLAEAAETSASYECDDVFCPFCGEDAEFCVCSPWDFKDD